MTLNEMVEIVLTTDLTKIRNWFPLIASDWLTSLRLRVVEPGARGLLIDLMAYTWDTGNPGVITFDNYLLFAQAYRFTREDAHLWLKQLSESEQSPVRVQDYDGLMVVLIPKLIQIAVEQIEKRESYAARGKLGGMAEGREEVVQVDTTSIIGRPGVIKRGREVVSRSKDVLIESGLNRLEVSEIPPQLPLDGTKLSCSRRDKKRVEESRREQSESVEIKTSKPKRKLTQYSAPFLKWYHGEGVEGYEGYPNKSGKQKAQGYWNDLGLDSQAEEIIKETMRQIEERKRVLKMDPGGFLRGWQMAKTFIGNESWEDSWLTPEVLHKTRDREEKQQRIMAYFPETGETKIFKDSQALESFARGMKFNIEKLGGEYRLTPIGDDDDESV